MGMRRRGGCRVKTGGDRVSKWAHQLHLVHPSFNIAMCITASSYLTRSSMLSIWWGSAKVIPAIYFWTIRDSSSSVIHQSLGDLGQKYDNMRKFCWYPLHIISLSQPKVIYLCNISWDASQDKKQRWDKKDKKQRWDKKDKKIMYARWDNAGGRSEAFEVKRVSSSASASHYLYSK